MKKLMLIAAVVAMGFVGNCATPKSCTDAGVWCVEYAADANQTLVDAGKSVCVSPAVWSATAGCDTAKFTCGTALLGITTCTPK
ncbi:MAG: hypothetical protein OEV66_04780 [Spirochaetia bacterium]|nr:hypothetical protein [Spirochaetia bacterium]